jgi:hypothetical protein
MESTDPFGPKDLEFPFFGTAEAISSTLKEQALQSSPIKIMQQRIDHRKGISQHKYDSVTIFVSEIFLEAGIYVRSLKTISSAWLVIDIARQDERSV